jgi:hypothetical protein
MKIIAHPNYPGLNILIAESAADKPIPAAFFVTVKTMVLSNIALWAYGMPAPPSTPLTLVNRINRSQYNMQKCYYRYDSANCYSARVNGAGAMSTSGYNPGAWLSLCNIDKAGVDGLGALLGTKYQVIWIPPETGEEPWDFVVPDPKKPDIKIVVPKNPTIPGVKIPGVDINVEIGKGATVIVGDDPEEPPKGEPEPEPEPVPEPPQKAGFGWIPAAVLGGGAIITMIYFAYKNRKKKGK